MAFGYRYKLERQENGWWLVRFPGIPEALTEGETQDEARRNALDCVIAALEGYMKEGKPLPRRDSKQPHLGINSGKGLFNLFPRQPRRGGKLSGHGKEIEKR
jgi:predicted RNase H-like HicB family nuclease